MTAQQGQLGMSPPLPSFPEGPVRVSKLKATYLLEGGQGLLRVVLTSSLTPPTG